MAPKSIMPPVAPMASHRSVRVLLAQIGDGEFYPTGNDTLEKKGKDGKSNKPSEFQCQEMSMFPILEYSPSGGQLPNYCTQLTQSFGKSYHITSPVVGFPGCFHHMLIISPCFATFGGWMDAGQLSFHKAQPFVAVRSSVGRTLLSSKRNGGEKPTTKGYSKSQLGFRDCYSPMVMSYVLTHPQMVQLCYRICG